MSSQYEINIARILDAVVMTDQLQHAFQSRLFVPMQCLLRRCLNEISETETTEYPIMRFTHEYSAAHNNLLINVVDDLVSFFRQSNNSPAIHTVLRHCQPSTRNTLRRILPNLEELERNVVMLEAVTRSRWTMLTRHNARYNLRSPSSPESEAAQSLPPTEVDADSPPNSPNLSY